MKLYKLTPQKNTAQAMVEFAIVLPLLLLLLYGLLEAGRLLFMYSTVVTASRQAARYGSATGQGGDYTAEGGPDNSTLSRFQDCYGIRRAAQRVDFLNAFDDDDIYITYDNGPGTVVPLLDPLITPPAAPPWRDVCDGTGDNAVSPDGNSTRIVVTIGGDFNPIIPRIVPFIARTRAGSDPIRAVSARTIITGVSIEVTPPPGSGGGPGTGGLSLSVTANPNSFTGPNEPINYTFTLTNGGTTDITGPFMIMGTPFAVDCTAATTPLTPGSSTDCAAVPVTYLTTAADVTTGFFEFTATATGTGSDGNPVTDDFTSKITYSAPVENPAISLTKTASTSLVTAGDQITYTFTVTNSGNVDLTGASVSDPKLGGTIAGCSGDLAVGGVVTCTATYIVTAADVQSGSVDNTATASATYGATTVTATASATADIYEGTLFLTASASPTSVSKVGDVITYTYRFKNNTSSDLYLQSSSPLPLSGHRTPSTPTNCPSGSIAANGGTVTCTLTYTVTQQDLDGGITNSVTGTACTETNRCNGGRDRTSNTVTVSVAVAATPSLSLQVTASPTAPTPPASSLTVGSQVTYTYTLTNLGNVTLAQPFTVTDALAGNFSCTDPGVGIAPGGTKACTGTHTISQADLDAGLIPSRQATASATFGSQTVSAAGPVPSVTTYSGARLSLVITANPTTYPAAPGTQTIIYTYRLTNTGTIPLGPSPLYLTSSQQSDGRNLTVSCPNTPLANSGDFIDCTATDTVSGPAGSKIVNTATATASDGTQTITSNTASVAVSNPVLACNSITASSISISNNTMSMTITNPNLYTVDVSSVEVTWNHDNGQQGNKALKLDRVDFGSTQVWNDTSLHAGPSLTFTPSSAVNVPAANPNPATITITFRFDNNYATTDGTEKIKINFSTAGCEATPVQQPPAVP